MKIHRNAVKMTFLVIDVREKLERKQKMCLERFLESFLSHIFFYFGDFLIVEF